MIFRKKCNEGVLKEPFIQLSSDTSSTRKITAQDVLVQLPRYRKFVLRIGVVRDKCLREKKEKDMQSQEKLLKRLKVSAKQEVSWWRTSADVPVLRFKKFERGKDNIVAGELSSFASRVPAVHRCSAGEIASKVTLVQNEDWQP